MPERIFPYRTFTDGLGKIRVVENLALETYLEILRASAGGNVSFVAYTRPPIGSLIKGNEYEPVEVCVDGDLESIDRGKSEAKGFWNNLAHSFGSYLVTKSNEVSVARVCIQTQNDALWVRNLIKRFGWQNDNIECISSLSKRTGSRSLRTAQ